MITATPPETGLVRKRPLSELRPSPENDKLYRPVDPSDPSIRSLAESIADQGLLEPIVTDLDGNIASGHRRHAACKLAGMESVPCRVLPIHKDDGPDAWVGLLRDFNRQREKTRAEKFRESITSADPEEAYYALLEHRECAAAVSVEQIELRGRKQRSRISKAKEPWLDAILAVLNARRKYWPLTLRQIHYGLLNDPPLKHASKPDSVYRNDKNSYKALSDLLTRVRLGGGIPMSAISDETRPEFVWNRHQTPTDFIESEMDRFLKNYRRDLMQSQPNHIEVVAEKNTVVNIIKPVAARYSLPLTSGRGFASVPPRYHMAQRFKASGKERLVVLMLSDFDPDGEEISHSFARTMRDDFGVGDIVPIKVALSAEHVERFDLPPMMKAKATSSNHDRFVDRHGDDVFELEALQPEDLTALLKDAIESVIDRDALNAEIEAEQSDALFLDGVRLQVHELLAELDLDEEFGQ